MALQNKTGTLLIWSILAIFAFVGGLFFYHSTKYDFKTLDQTKYTHADLKGSVVIVNYFAEWCAPCLREIPELNEFYHQAPSNVKLFAVSFDALSPKKLAEIKTKYNIQFPLVSEMLSGFSFGKPQYLPATFIVKPSGEVAGQLLGEQTTASLNDAISAL
jgi:thiol-disulfide isomerase/thioredoxin